MDLDELNTLDPGSETPTTEQSAATPSNETEIEVEDEGSPDPDIETEETTAEPEEDAQDDPWKGYVEVEIDGKTYRVPEEVKDGYLRNEDYTRKRQADAEFRRSLDAKAAEIERMREVSEEELQARSAKMGIAAQLKQYETVDWDQFETNDPLGATQHFRRYQQMKDAQQQIDQFLDQTQKTRTEAAEREIATRVQETTEYARKNLKGWTPELDEKLTSFAVTELGFSKDELVRAINPKVYQTLYLAHLGQQTLSKQSAPPKPKAPPPAPLTTVAAKGGAVRKTPATMSVDEMAAYLNKRS